MPYIAWYLLKLSLSLSVVYLFYILVLRRLTFYTWNRWYLLGYSLLAFFIPFVDISPVLEQSEWDKNLLIQLIPVFNNVGTGYQAELSQPTAWWSYLIAGALIGIVLMMVRFLIRFFSYQRIRRSARLMVDIGVKVYHVEKSIIPFSFGNAIFINPQLHAEEDLKQIIHHEFIHVKQRHTIDILWGELLCMLNWYNPFAWLIRKAIRQNLEFIADHKVLENGIDKKHYQYLLLKVTGAAHFSLTQQFNFSSLKKRIIMMNRSRSAKIQLMRFLFLLPLLTILLLAFRTNVIEHERVSQIAATRLNLQQLAASTIAALTDTVPAQSKNDNWRTNFLKNNRDVKKLDIQKTVHGTFFEIYRQDGVSEKYNWNDPRARDMFRKRYGATDDIPKDISAGANETVVADTAFNLMTDASLHGPGNPYLRPVMDSPLVIVDGVPMDFSKEKLNDIKPDDIESITVLKGADEIRIYGDKAKHGVILIKTKNAPYDLKIESEMMTVSPDSAVFRGKPNIVIRDGHIPASLYIVDGIEFSADEFKKLDIVPNSIESISVLKGESATNIYGQKGKDGVIIIKLKRPITKIDTPEEWDSERLRAMFKSSEQVVWFVNGNTYVVAAGGGTFAMQPGIINTILVNDRFYTPDEVNRQFKRSQFNSAAALDPASMQKAHGMNISAMAINSPDHPFDMDRYSVPKDKAKNPINL